MRALLINPKAQKSFWSFEQTLEMVARKALSPPMGLLTVAALLPQDWELRFVDRNFQTVSGKLWDWADIVLLSGMFIQKDDLLALIGEAKSRGISVTVGGPYVTSVPDEVLAAGADFIVKGEVENTLGGWISALAAGKTGGVFEEQGKPDMATSPIPRYDLLELESYNCMNVQTSRGCPFNCEFCDIINLYGRTPRYKSPDQVLAELQTLYELGWNGGVFFCDDNFIGNKKHAKAILAKITPWMKAHGEPFGFWAQVSVNLGEDLEMIDLMAAANFGYVFIGIESPDEEVLAGAHKYQNIKNSMSDSIRTINRNGLSVMGSFILGFDHEKQGAGERICRFVTENNIPSVLLNNLQIAPNTALWNRLEQENRLLKHKTDGQSLGGALNYIPTRPEAEILREYRDTVNTLYEPSGYLRRTYNYYLKMRPTRRAIARKEGEKIAREPGMDNRPPQKVIRDRRIRPGIQMLWSWGIISPHRIQFWRQFIGICLNNPSRLSTYMLTLAMGENFFPLRKIVRDRVAGRLGNGDLG